MSQFADVCRSLHWMLKEEQDRQRVDLIVNTVCTLLDFMEWEEKTICDVLDSTMREYDLPTTTKESLQEKIAAITEENEKDRLYGV